MRPLTKIYFARIGLGIVAAFICIGYGIATNTITNDPALFAINTLTNGISLALITYLVSYYALKRMFAYQVEKPQKIFTMGIGIYFITWLVFWIFLYTLVAGPPPSIP
jgi:hypothetical protein